MLQKMSVYFSWNIFNVYQSDRWEKGFDGKQFDLLTAIRMEVALTRPDYLPSLSAAKTSKLSLLVKHHISAIDEAC